MVQAERMDGRGDSASEWQHPYRTKEAGTSYAGRRLDVVLSKSHDKHLIAGSSDPRKVKMFRTLTDRDCGRKHRVLGHSAQHWLARAVASIRALDWNMGRIEQIICLIGWDGA